MSGAFDRDADADAAWQAYKAAEWHGWDSIAPDLHQAFLAGWVARPVRPVPPQTIDPQALMDVFANSLGAVELFDNVVALVVPNSRFDTIRALHVYAADHGLAFCRECTQSWPCATIRALDGDA